MISAINISINATNPKTPLPPLRAFIGSQASIRVTEVPRKVGNWEITRVYVAVTLPDNRICVRDCVKTGYAWMTNVPASTVSGRSLNGYLVKADGIDERGDPVEGYVLGVGDVEILTTDGTISRGSDAHYIHVLPSAPSEPKEGDAYVDGGVWRVYNGEAWVTLGGTFAGNGWAQYPVSMGGDGKWHRIIIAHGSIAYDEEGVDEPVDNVYAAHVAARDNPHAVTKAQVGLGSVDNTADADKPVSTAQQAALDRKANAAALASHEARNDNPHAVTKAQVGLGSVDNTADADKPVSAAQQAALDRKANAAALDAENARAEAAERELNDAIVNEAARAGRAEGYNARAISQHTENTDNPHAVTKAQVGLGNVDNTSDANKPVSAATQTALNLKADDSAAVHKSGDEELIGTKTFRSDIISLRSGNIASCVGKFAGLTRGANPESEKRYDMRVVDGDGRAIVKFVQGVRTDGKRFISLVGTSDSGDDVTLATFSMNADGTGAYAGGSALAAAGMPSVVSSDGFATLENMATFTAPKNGWLTVACMFSEAGSRLGISVANGCYYNGYTHGTDQVLAVSVPMRAGDLATLYMSGTIPTGGTYRNNFRSSFAEY